MDIVYSHKESVYVKGFRNFAVVIVVLIVLQITYGAFVAGLKAGYGNHTLVDVVAFPKKTGSILNNGTTTLFIHRMIGILIFITAPIFWIWARGKGVVGRQNRGFIFLNISIGVQFVLGILTLLFMMPDSIGFPVIHQAGAVVTLSSGVYLWHQLK